MNGPAEIGDLQLSLQAEQQVFWLDVAVDHLLRVAVFERVSHLSNVPRRSANAERWLVMEHKAGRVRL